MGENGADSRAIDIEGLVRSIKAQMAQDRFMSPDCCIFKTPTILRELNEKAYVPHAFSIGPFHHRRGECKDTQKIKIEYLDGLISRFPPAETTLRNLINSVDSVEKEARACYAGSIDYKREEFVKILVIDGCFIIELLRKMAYVQPRGEDDPIFTVACLPASLYRDLILLENQVPWKVLEILFNMTPDPPRNPPRNNMTSDPPRNNMTSSDPPRNNMTSDPPRNNMTSDPPRLIEMVKLFIDNFLVELPSGHPPIGQDQEYQDSKHIVDVGRKLLVSSIAMGSAYSGPDWTLLPSATSLVEAGVKIKRGESRSILDLKYDNGVLEIPPLKIDETTETLFRNIISFEQCYPKCEPMFTSYAILLDNLINTAKDVDILCENKIIKNWLNPENAIPFFNNLYTNTCVKKIYYQSLCKNVHGYCNRRWPRWHATLVRNYFNTPWAILSTVAAVILLILTFVQTWFAIS